MTAVALNGRALARGQVSGVERYATEIGHGLLRMRPDRYVLLRPRGPAGGPAGHVWEQIVLPARAARRRATIVYSPANLAPLVWPRSVVVLHDAAVWRHPECFSLSYAAWHQRLEAACARRALMVVTVSDFCRRELVEVLGLDPAKVSVVSPGVGDSFQATIDPGPVCRRHGLERPYVLTVGTADRRKNLGVLVGLARRLATEDIEVAWAGGSQAHMPDGAPSGAVRALGYVSDVDLPGLYAGARALVLPSRYEGFGLPCVEAMACGTPVVAANRGALPETCGNAALLVDPDDPVALGDAVRAAATDGALRARLRSEGMKRAADMTWRAAVLATDELLDGLAAQLG